MTAAPPKSIHGVKAIAVNRYVVQISDEEREQLDTLVHGSKHSAPKPMKAVSG